MSHSGVVIFEIVLPYTQISLNSNLHIFNYWHSWMAGTIQLQLQLQSLRHLTQTLFEVVSCFVFASLDSHYYPHYPLQVHRITELSQIA
jgi:hypothetical protein